MNVYISSSNMENEVVLDLMTRIMVGGADVSTSENPGGLLGGTLASVGLMDAVSSLSAADVMVILLDEEWYSFPKVQAELAAAQSLIKQGKGLRIYFASLDGEEIPYNCKTLTDAPNLFDLDELVRQIYRQRTWN